MLRKFSLDNAVTNKTSYIAEGKYGFDEDCEDVSIKLRIISFEQIDYKLFYNNRLILNLLKDNDIFLLVCEVVNMMQQKTHSFNAYPCVILIDNMKNYYYPWGNFDNFNNSISDHLEKRGLHNLQSAWIDFPPAVTLKGVISYLIPKDESRKYYLSVTYEDEEHYFKDGSICTEKEYNEREHTEIDSKDALSGDGWVYALVNPSMTENFVKIGMTTRDVETRVRELSSKTAVPTPFQIIYMKEVSNCSRVESLIHNKLKKYRYKKNREFFEVPPDKLVPFLDKLCSHFPKENPPVSSDVERQQRIQEIEDQLGVLQQELKQLKGI